MERILPKSKRVVPNVKEKKFSIKKQKNKNKK